MNAIYAIASVVLRELQRRKDFYVLFVLTALLCAVMASASFFNEAAMGRYVREFSLQLIWLSSLVIAVATAARQIPAEKESRTILPLLAKPVSRLQVVLGKFLGCWLASGVTLLVFYMFFGCLSGLKDHQWPVWQYFQAAWLHWWMLGVVTAMVLAGSVTFAAPSSNATICAVVIMGILLFGRHLRQAAVTQPEPVSTILSIAYFTLPHLEFFDARDLLIHTRQPIPLAAWLGCTLYGAVYTAFFVLLCWARFNRPAFKLTSA